MDPQDALGPLIEHLGVFVRAVGGPVTGVAVALLAMFMNQRRHHLLAAVAVGISYAALGVVVGTAHVGLTAACVLGAAGSLVQAWIVWPVAQVAKRIGRRLRSRAGV